MITVDDYFKLKVIQNNYNFLFKKYELEFKIPANEIYKGFIEYKQDSLDIISPDNCTIFDISGHSLFSPLLLFQGRYSKYYMRDPGVKMKTINYEIYKEIGMKFNVNYLNEASQKFSYDVILDWNGDINFGTKMNIQMMIILNEMIKLTRKYVIFEAKRFLTLGDSVFDFFDFFESQDIVYYTKKTPKWMNDHGCFLFVLEV